MNRITLLTCILSFVSGMANALEITVLRDDFEAPYIYEEVWTVEFSSGANVYVDSGVGQLILETVPNTSAGTATVTSKKQIQVGSKPIRFTSRIMDAYVDQGIYGNAQPRGLAAGADRNNAIEFVNAYPVPNTVECRTVSNGAVTSTRVNIGQSVGTTSIYQIIATSDVAMFYINGKLVAVHSNTIPTVPLNVYFGTGDSGAGNVPLTIDYVSLERAFT